jgi:hypothetical protein
VIFSSCRLVEQCFPVLLLQIHGIKLMLLLNAKILFFTTPSGPKKLSDRKLRKTTLFFFVNPHSTLFPLPRGPIVATPAGFGIVCAEHDVVCWMTCQISSVGLLGEHVWCVCWSTGWDCIAIGKGTTSCRTRGLQPNAAERTKPEYARVARSHRL